MQHLLSNLSTPILHFSGIIAFIHLVYQILYLRTESRLYLRKKIKQQTHTNSGFHPSLLKKTKSYNCYQFWKCQLIERYLQTALGYTQNIFCKHIHITNKYCHKKTLKLLSHKSENKKHRKAQFTETSLLVVVVGYHFYSLCLRHEMLSRSDTFVSIIFHRHVKIVS